MSSMPDAITIREARPHEAEQLSDLALRSKGHWGYPEDFLAACADELTIHRGQIEGPQMDIIVAERSGCIAGFYALAQHSGSDFELDALFVEPQQIGSGVGRDLLKHALDVVAARSGSTLLIQGDPHAEAFYRAAGARQVGSRESGSIPGRLLPIYEIAVRQR